MRLLPLVLFCAICLACARGLSAEPTAADAAPIGLTLIDVRMIWDKAPHNAFTDLCRFENTFYLSFREAASRENECDYCMAAHSAIADMQQLPADVIEAIRDDREITDGKLESLRRFTAETVRTRGWPSDSTRAQFFEAGYTEASALEVILGIGMKTLSNYTNHLAETPLDGQFKGRRWTAANG
jgi:hypothetical protein